MSHFICKQGTVAFGTVWAAEALEVVDITTDIQCDTSQFEYMSAAQWASVDPSQLSWSGGCTVALDATNGIKLASLLAQTLSIVVDTVDGPTLTGNAVVSRIVINCDVTDTATAEISWEGSGALTETV